VFLSSRIYGGYEKLKNSTVLKSPEPFPYEYGFSVKWLVEAQINQMKNGGKVLDSRAGDLNYNTVAPWIAWGPYLWTDGANPRKTDGLAWLREDLANADGLHPSTSGEQKVGRMLLDFFKTDPTTKTWFAHSNSAKK